MNWDAIGAIAESIGAAAVVASLVYLSLQIRASTRASAVESKLQTTRLLTDVLDSVVEAPELNDLYQRGLANLDSLSKDEYLQFSNIALKMFRFFQRLTSSTAWEPSTIPAGARSPLRWITGCAGQVPEPGG
ncbi:MAG: hypothetical protein JRG86_05855 [Deltaproteobacteria bacterium]|nr:hypothetical protein [Deltaproteobacteria bacterium]